MSATPRFPDRQESGGLAANSEMGETSWDMSDAQQYVSEVFCRQSVIQNCHLIDI